MMFRLIEIRTISSPAAFVLAVSVLAPFSAARATVINYVANGSFENGFANWTVTTGPGAVSPGNGPSLVVTNGTYVNAYGDKIVSDNATSPYSNADKGGSSAAYFVDDVATERLAQTMYLTAGTYEVGFDLYETPSGASNTNDSFFSATVAGITILAADIGTFVAGTWQHFAGNVTVTSSGNYNVGFLFKGGASAAKDVVVDDVYVINPSTLQGLGVVVPEPSGLAAIAAGLGAVVFLRRRR